MTVTSANRHGATADCPFLGKSGANSESSKMVPRESRSLSWVLPFGITQTLRINSGYVLQVETGSLYPALHRLERHGWVRSQWKQTESNQHAKYYRITAAGKKQQASDHGRWQQMVSDCGDHAALLL